MMRTAIPVALLTLVLSGACSKGDDKKAPEPSAAPAEGQPPGDPKKRKSNIVKVQMAVPYGKQVACTDVFLPATFSKYIGDEIGEMKDKSSSNKESSVSCAFHRAGEPPKDDAQLRKFQKEGLKLGVLPADEYCMVTAYCSTTNDDEQFRKTCEARGDSGNETLGLFACVHQTQRGVENAYTYKVVDPETKCTLEIMGGPSVTDETLVQNCTRAALEDMSPDKLKNFH